MSGKVKVLKAKDEKLELTKEEKEAIARKRKAQAKVNLASGEIKAVCEKHNVELLALLPNDLVLSIGGKPIQPNVILVPKVEEGESK